MKGIIKHISPAIIVLLLAALMVPGCGKKDSKEPAKDGPAAEGKIKIVAMQNAAEPIVSFRFVFHTGSMKDPAGKNGLAFLTAQMLANGGTKTLTYQQILKKLYPIASSYSVRVDREYTTIYGQTHQDNADKFYGFLKAAILEPGFKEDDFKRLKAALLNYLKNTLRYSSDEELGKAVFKSFVYEGTPYENPVRGTVSGLEAITLEDVKKFYKENYCHNRLIVGLSGNYKNTLVKNVTADFSALPEAKGPARPEIKPKAIKGLQVVIVEKPGESTGVHIGFPIKLMRAHGDFHDLFLANSWMGEHRNSSSHLYQVIRETRGMNYGDYSYIEDFPNGGRRQFPPANVYKNPQLFEIWIRPVEKGKGLFAARAAVRELKTLVDNGMTPEAFKLTKQFLSKYCLHFATTGAQRLGYKIDDLIFGLKAPHLDNFKKHIDAATHESVNAAIKKHLQYENLKIVFVTSNAEALKKALIENTPSPITYRTPKPEEVLKEDKIIEAFPLKVLPENIKIIKVDKVFE